MNKKEFVRRVGAIEILCGLSGSEKSFGELKELGISSGTLSKRLKEAIRLGLIKQEVRQQEVRNEKDALKPKVVYKLTEEGRDLLKSIEHVKEEYLKIKEEIGRLKEEVKRKEEEIKKLLEKL